MIKRTELDMAQLKVEMRQLYRNIGFDAALVVFSDMLIGARVLGEVMVEEKRKESHNG